MCNLSVSLPVMFLQRLMLDGFEQCHTRQKNGMMMIWIYHCPAFFQHMQMVFKMEQGLKQQSIFLNQIPLKIYLIQ
uniref:Uncharacterized protein n=1 Tax=Rhizophora mucronata TaxID=61149 RepID=A0A2P2R2P0_RHIMU